MKRVNFLCLFLISTSLQALSLHSFRDNMDIPVLLSDGNYNRLVVRGDKITQAHFPLDAMAIKNEEDGSLYVMVAQKEPFTLFLTTEAGHHFSATVTSESALGKTIEFVPKTIASSAVKTATSTSVSRLKPKPDAIETLMGQMVKAENVSGFEIKHHHGRVIRLQQGLVLIPKITYFGLTLNGEVTEIYNGGKLPVNLDEGSFMSPDTKAVSLSQINLLPRQKAMVYRVLERGHG